MAPGATRNARGTSGRTWSRGRGWGAEGNPSTPLVSLGRANFGGISGSSSTSSSDGSRTSSDTSNNNDSGDLHALVERPERDLEVFGELPALQSGRTRSQSRGLIMSASCTDALLTYAMRTVEAKRTVEEEEAAEIERARDSLLEERLEKKREWLEELERRGALLEQLEEEQYSDCSLAMVVEQQPELRIPSPIGREPSEVESPPHTVAGVERSVYRKGWEQAMKLEFEGHMKTGTFSTVSRVPERRKPVGSEWRFDYKTDKVERPPSSKQIWLPRNSRRSVTWITPTHFPPVRHQHPISWCSQ